MSAEHKFATFAGGCFWCTESSFLNMPGVIAVTNGYTGGDWENPTYEDVCSGETGHAEAVRVTYDPDRVAYRDLLDVFWRSIDPTDGSGQFADRGSQYRTVIFYHSEAQKAEAEASRDALNASGRFRAPVATTVEPAQAFFPAEEYHQQFCLKNPSRFRSYHHGSGKHAALASLWNDARKQEK